MLLVVSSIISWWGYDEDTSQVPYTSSQGLDIGPWLAETWAYYVFPGTIYRPATTLTWWEFAVQHPEYAGYGAAAATLMALWIAAVVLVPIALLARAKPRSRLKGFPTIFEWSAAGALFTAALVAALWLPGAVNLPGFIGSAGPIRWGPRPGWFLAVAAAAFVSASAAIGWTVDRRLRGLCWKCYRVAEGRVCGYCEALQ